jgi:hypothetical protein
MGSFDEFIDDIARSFENRHDQAIEGFPSHTLCRYTSLISTLSHDYSGSCRGRIMHFPWYYGDAELQCRPSQLHCRLPARRGV